MNTCAGVGFRKIAQHFVDLGSTYKAFDVAKILPHPSTVSRNIKNSFAEAMKSNVQGAKDANIYSAYGIAGTTDHWTCKFSHDSFTSLSVHYITRDWELKNCLLALKKYPDDMDKRAQTQAMIMNDLREKLTIDKQQLKITWVTDSEATQLKAIKEMGDDGLPCIAHKLNTVLQTVFSKSKPALKGIQDSIKCIKEIVTFFKKGFHMGKLQTSLKQCGETRWNSHLTMLKSFQAAFDQLKKVIPEIDTPDDKYQALLENVKMEEIDCCVEILEEFKKASDFLESSNWLTLPYAYMVVHELQNFLFVYADKPVKTNASKQLARDLLKVSKEKIVLDKNVFAAMYFNPLTRTMNDVPATLKSEVQAMIQKLMNTERMADTAQYLVDDANESVAERSNLEDQGPSKKRKLTFQVDFKLSSVTSK